MKLTTMTQVTIDGVMQGNGAASDEDRRNGFERGGWARGKGDHETMTFINQTYQRADAFLLGRRTYELFAGSWGSWRVQDVPRREARRAGVEHTAQVRGIDHAHRSGAVGHHRPVRRPCDRHRGPEGQAGG
jgi:dihydrofolate reductase